MRFDGDPSLITAVTLGASRPVAVTPTAPVTPPGMSEAEVAKLRAQLAAAEKARGEAEARAKMVGKTTPANPAAVPTTTIPGPSTEAPSSAPMAKADPVPAPAFPASSGMEGTRAGEVREFGGIEMVWCPPGEFLMGSPRSEAARSGDERQHRVTLTRGFWLAKTEATQGQWESVMGSNPSHFKGVDRPVESLSWDDVQGWFKKMNKKHSLPAEWKWSLPTEAQWEYACRAWTETAFSFGNVLTGMEANVKGSPDRTFPYGIDAKGPYLERTVEVGSYEPNNWGLHDMHGNVSEWCVDWYDEGLYDDYNADGRIDPTGPETSGSYRVHRGGRWGRAAEFCRSANRDFGSPDSHYNDVGFRPALVPSNIQSE